MPIPKKNSSLGISLSKNATEIEHSIRPLELMVADRVDVSTKISTHTDKDAQIIKFSDSSIVTWRQCGTDPLFLT